MKPAWFVFAWYIAVMSIGKIPIEEWIVDPRMAYIAGLVVGGFAIFMRLYCPGIRDQKQVR